MTTEQICECGRTRFSLFDDADFVCKDCKPKEQHKLIFDFMCLIERADNKTLLEMKDILQKEIHLSEICIKEGYEK